MWALVDTNLNTVLRGFPRPVPFTLNLRQPDQLDAEGNPVVVFGDVNFPAGVFRSAGKLKELNILPVRRIQVNAPDDTSLYTSAAVDTVLADVVERRVTWTPVATGEITARATELRRHFNAQVLEQARNLVRQRGDKFGRVTALPQSNAFVTSVQAEYDTWRTAVTALPLDVDFPGAAQTLIDAIPWPDP